MSPTVQKILIKIERAKENLRDLNSEILAFLGSSPYEIGTKHDPETRKLIYYISKCNPVPARIAAIAGNIFSDLRGSLDHLAYALVAAGSGGGSGAPVRHVYFPIASSAEDYASAVSRRKVKGMSQSAIEAINAIKPYKGGNDLLWALNELNKIDKHRAVILVGSAFRSMDIGAIMAQMFREAFPNMESAFNSSPNPIPLFLRPKDRMCPLKVGDELYIGAPDEKVNENLQFRFDISFGEPGIIDGEPAVAALYQMIDLVYNIIIQFDTMLV